MNTLRIVIAGFSLSGCVLAPAMLQAAQNDILGQNTELEITMQVLDSVAGIDANILLVSTPEAVETAAPDNNVEDFFADSAGAKEENSETSNKNDNFATDRAFLNDMEQETRLADDEGDFDDGEAIDDDELATGN